MSGGKNKILPRIQEKEEERINISDMIVEFGSQINQAKQADRFWMILFSAKHSEVCGECL